MRKSKLKIVLATRGSRLATTQTNWIIKKLKAAYPDVEFEMKIIKMKDDMNQEGRLDKIGDRGTFNAIIEEELASGGIDLAVCSMKDIPFNLPKGFCLAVIGVRDDPRDAIILMNDYHSIEELPQGARIGIESKCIGYQLQTMRPDLEIVHTDGEIDTRIRALKEENLEGIVLAVADLKRLGLEEHITYCFGVDEIIPAPGQGILVIEAKEENPILRQMIQAIEDPISTIQYQAEYSFMREINTGYQVVMGAYCSVDGMHLRMKGLLGDKEGKHLVVKEMSAPVGAEEQLGIELGQELKRQLEKISMDKE